MKKNTQTNKQTVANKSIQVNIISLVQRLGWVFDRDTHERQKERSSVIITIPIPQSTINIQIHPLQNNIHRPRSIAGVPSSQALPGASLLLYPTCVRSCCNWRATCVVTKQQNKIKMTWIAGVPSS